MVSLDFEHEVGDVVVGVDEAGRGPLAGGVYAAAVSLSIARAEALLAGEWSAVNDSKKLSEKRREALAETIKATGGCKWCVASASPAEIDRLNILRATHLAMRRAVEGLGLDGKITILVDGLPVPGLPFPSKNIVKGDAKSLLIKFIRRAKKELIVIDAYPGVANGECCQCVNVASGQFQFPIEEAA